MKILRYKDTKILREKLSHHLISQYPNIFISIRRSRFVTCFETFRSCLQTISDRIILQEDNALRGRANPLRRKNKNYWLLKIPALQAGFTLPEVVVITGIFLMLFGFIALNVINSQHRTSVTESVGALIADIKSQQLKAMVGATEGRATADVYGIHFGSTTYTLFHGSTYSSSDTSNFVVDLDQNLQFYNITFPNSNIIFSQGSGEVSGFTNGQNTITIKDNNGSNQKTVTVNRFGVVTSIN